MGIDYIRNSAGQIAQWNGMNVYLPETYSNEYQPIYDLFTTKPDVSVADAQNTMVSSLVGAGLWDRMDIFYLFANNASDNALINWKNPGTYDADKVGASEFTTMEGYEGSTGDFISTNFIPASNGVNYALDSAGIGIYPRFDIQENNYLFGGASNTRCRFR